MPCRPHLTTAVLQGVVVVILREEGGVVVASSSWRKCSRERESVASYRGADLCTMIDR